MNAVFAYSRYSSIAVFQYGIERLFRSPYAQPLRRLPLGSYDQLLQLIALF